MTTVICKECDNDAFDEGDDRFFYCLQCGVMADNIIQTGVGDFIGEGGSTHGAMYNPINRRNISQQLTPSQPRYTQDAMRYSQFRSQLKSASQVPKSGIEKDFSQEVKGEPENYLDKEPTEPVDFGAETLSYEDYYNEARDRYVKAFLMMITYQCDALVEKFNVTPLIIGLFGPICLRYVALSGVYDDDWADNAIRDSELQSEDGELKDVKQPKTHKAEPGNLDGKRAVTIWVSMHKKTLPLSSSLAISFLACHKAGAPVLPTDIVR